MSKGFGFPGGNMQALVKQAQKMQENLQKVQSSVAEFTAEGSAGGGMVKAVARGDNRLLNVSIEQEVIVGGDRDLLQDLVLAAVNDALDKVQEMAKSEMAKVAGGLNIPGLF
jgi:DNA-binding YbaB/EbfC family protein